MEELRRRTTSRRSAVALLALGITAFLCLSGAYFSAVRVSDDGEVLGSPPSRRHRRLQDDADGDAEIPLEDEESASASFDPDEDAEVLEEMEDVEAFPREGPVDVEEEFEEVNESTEDEDALFALQEMKMRLKPRGPLDLSRVDGDSSSNATKQFAHLHHMKTGGTSINRVISCAVNRARNGDNGALPFFSLSECGALRYRMCTEGTDESAERCRDQINASAVMQYCAPLFQMERFGWLGDRTDVITVLRNPIDRVWSMFRFQTKRCYRCTPLVDIYKMIDDGTIDDWCDANRGSGKRPQADRRGCDGVCMPQLLDHQTRNLMTTQWESPEGMAMSDQERMDEALHNLRTNIAVVGITEELPTFRDMVGQVFPWMAESLEAGEEVVDEGATGEDPSAQPRPSKGKSCPLPHANASPRNNRCGEDGRSHWDLPDHPDDETVEAILRHNQLDMKLYEAALERFKLQKRAIGWE